MTGGLRPRESGRGTRSAGFLPADTLAGFLIAILAVVLIALFTYRSLVTRSITATRITQTLDAVQRLEELLSSVKDAETGERGFLLTGDERYLEPYTAGRAALGGAFTSLRSQLSTDAEQQQRVAALQQLADDWMALSAETVAMRRAGSTEAATDVARSDRAKAGMDRIRSLVAAMEDAERAVLAARQEEWQQAVIFSSRVTWGGSVVLLVLIAGAAVTASRQYRAREKEMWIRAGQTDLSDRLRGEQRLDSLGEKILAFLAEYLHALVGAIYIRDRAGTFRRFASHALSPANADDVVRPGDGLLGQAAKDNRPLRVRDVPDGYLGVASSLGHGKPLEIIIAPAGVDGAVHAVLELGFFHRVLPADLELLERISESLGIAIRSSKDRTRLEELLEETQRQAEELQTQQEELRVSNEELEEQTNVLKQSQARLENQQAELEQTNSQLEEQSQLLEAQKDELTELAGGDPREGRRARARQPVQERVPGQHEPRAADAAELVTDPREAARRQQDGQPHGGAGEVRGDDLLRRERPPHAHQRHPRSVEDRGWQNGSAPRASDHRRTPSMRSASRSRRQRRRRSCTSTSSSSRPRLNESRRTSSAWGRS